VGNHDVAALGQIDLDTFNEIAKIAAEWTQRNMSGDTRAHLESLGQIEELPEITLVHGSPRDPVWEYMDDARQAPMNFARFTTPFCFVGHTHVPKIFQQDVEMRRVTTINPRAAEVVEANDTSRLIINPGSVGQPRDGDPRASYGMFDTDRGAFELRRVTYNVPSTQDQILKAGLPKELADRLELGL
jgi:diadenosine tetraphosphatase ApaH/serine/threonine PP2A family protein phosphatase